MGRLLIDWHFSDPPSDLERWRNNKIEEIQGTRNPFIDNPDLADTLDFGDSPQDEAQDCLIKGNISKSGKIYHTPDSKFYKRVKIDTSKGERWFCTVEDAIDAGWRAPY